MSTLNLNRLALLILSPVSLCGAAAGHQATESTRHVMTAVYPNNSQGLVTLLNDALVAARNNDRTRMQSMIRDMEIPDYENWFTTTFGEEKGESWAEPYGKLLQKNQRDFEELLFRLSRMEGQFSVHQFDAASRYDTLKSHLDEYLADWINPGAPKTEQVVHIADFFFVEGKFRWDSTVEYLPFQKPKTGSIVPAKLVKKVQPGYPANATIRVLSVVQGDPALSPAAVEAVRQWRYEPWQLNGQPIDMETIDVVFSLTN